ncbi:DUF4332 domain-containing protein, partial [Xanthovirga aplysinae]|uniref:DUF4332 domain-containing protein n=1 Tax=Xanthovirga aplysinae TaxID=2529853 RepID=UPI0012BBAB60
RKLQKANIHSMEQLMNMCGNRTGRQQVSLQTGIKEDELLKWADQAELYRIPGMGGEYGELLEASGVNNLKSLGNKDGHDLFLKMTAVNKEKHIASQLPSEQQVKKFIREAKKLKPRISH